MNQAQKPQEQHQQTPQQQSGFAKIPNTEPHSDHLYQNLVNIQGINTQPIINVSKTPQEIALPWPRFKPILRNSEVETIIPCTLAPKQEEESRRRKTDESFMQSRMSMHRGEQLQRSKIMTGVLLDKIGLLEGKVKQLQEEKRSFELKLGQNINLLQGYGPYQSTPNNLPQQFGSIRRNDLSKNFNTVSDTNQSTNKGFRVRQGSNSIKSQGQLNNRLHSNIYSMTVIEKPQQQNIKQQLKILRQKLASLQKNQVQQTKVLKEKEDQSFSKSRGQQVDEKCETPTRRDLKGKIIKRNTSLLSQSLNNSFQEGKSSDNPKNFVRSDPRGVHSVIPHNGLSEYAEGHAETSFNREESIQRKRPDSSAIFRKNPGPAIQRGQSVQDEYQAREFQTLEFNPEKQKFIVLDSKETSQIMEQHKQKLSQMVDIQLPDLEPAPTPDCNSDELIEIGKLTFKKFGCQITENTLLNVRKFKNCVHFSISKEENILWHYEGKIYFGGWKSFTNGEGQKHGEGLEYIPGKYRFKGYYVDGKKNGYGLMILQNGTIYSGQWEDGLKHGRGRQEDSDRIVYEGEWKGGKKNGFGKIFNHGKLEFEGLFLKGFKNGHGKEFFDNGDSYEGEYVNHKFEGKGTYNWASGAVYLGQFKNGKRNGHGSWKSEQGGDSYEGQYKDDLKNGYGVYHWANGSVYEGSFKDDLKHGEGTITYENGKIAHLIWNRGNVQRKLQMSSRNRHEIRKRTPRADPNQFQFKRASGARSVQNLQSAKSTSTVGDRSLPKGLNKKSLSTRKPFQTRVNSGEFIKLKLGDELKDLRGSKQTNLGVEKNPGRGPPKDPPYRGMQMSSNPNMNL